MMKAASDQEIAAHYLAASQHIGNRRTFLRLERLEGYRALMQEVVDALPSMPKDALILWGTHDAYFRNEHLELRVLLHDSRLVMLEGGGHFPQEDAPDAITRELNAFLTAVQRGKFGAVYPVMRKRGFGHIEGVCSGFYGRKVGATQCARYERSDALILPTGARSLYKDVDKGDLKPCR